MPDVDVHSAGVTEDFPSVVVLWEVELSLVQESVRCSLEDLSDGSLKSLVEKLTWKGLSCSLALLIESYCLFQDICTGHGEKRRRLRDMGVYESLANLLREESESGQVAYARFGDSTCVTIGHLASLFLPAVPQSPCIDLVNARSAGIMASGPISGDFSGHCKEMFYSESDYEIAESCPDYDEFDEEVVPYLKAMFPTIFSIFRESKGLFLHAGLLLKMLYWAEQFNVLTDLVEIEELVSFAECLLLTKWGPSVTLTLAMLHLLMRRYSDSFMTNELRAALNAARPIAVEMMEMSVESSFDWIDDIYNVSEQHARVMNEKNQAEMLAEKVQQNNLRYDEKLYLLKEIVEFLLIDIELCDLGLRYDRLRAFIQVVLKPTSNLKEESKDNMEIIPSVEGMRSFQNLVRFAVDLFDDVQIFCASYVIVEHDMFPSVYLHREKPILEGHWDVNLGLERLPTLDRVLGATQNVRRLLGNPLTQTLRFASILHAVNEGWGTLFGQLTSKRLIDRKYFVSILMEQQFVCSLPSTGEPRHTFYDLVDMEYHFLFSRRSRSILFERSLHRHVNLEKVVEGEVTFMVSRDDVVNSIAESFRRAPDNPRRMKWNFKFVGEEGSGPGPTKEFYTEFSRECHENRLNVWINGERSDGSDCAYSSGCLYPAPSNRRLKTFFRNIARVMAKSLVDGHRLDVNFSTAFYKHLFGSQLFTLSDVVDAVPSLGNFLRTLIRALRKRKDIESNPWLTQKQRREAISAITCDGTSFEDLIVDFTFPGSQYEMIERGSDIYLTIDNVEEYLQLLVWHLFYGNTNLRQIGKEFNRFVPTFHLNVFYPDEINELLCGTPYEKWTVDYLEKHCIFENGLTAQSPCVRYLLEVLASLETNEQRQFLLFVTSLPRLPVGGLSKLKPKLKIIPCKVAGCPDDYLPWSMTCINALFIADYSSKEALRGKLLLAVKEGVDSFQFC